VNAQGASAVPSAAVTQWMQVLHGQAARVAVPEPAAPSPSQVRDAVALLAVPDDDRDDVLATMPDPVRTPGLWAALCRSHQVLFAESEPGRNAVEWPHAPAELGAAGRYFYVHVFVAALPFAMATQRRLGIPADVTRHTFADLGAKMALHRSVHGVGGLGLQAWLVRHFRGTLFRLGRLQFERTRLDAGAYGGSAEPDGPADGDRVLDVHVAEDGPLTPAACDASFAAARPFFARHFPDEPYTYATCRSWLLDDQLGEYLPATANIVGFQRRFRLFGDRPVGDDDTLGFVFHVPPGPVDLDRLPQDSTLHRVLVAHLRTGGHWRPGTGWTRLP
jgi:hypothetical protein